MPGPGEPLAPSLADIRLHPIKGMDPISVPEARIGPNGGLELDRVWALYSLDGNWVNGKRAPAIHLLRAEYDSTISSVTASVSPGAANPKKLQPAKFGFPSEFEPAPVWFTEYFGQQVIVRHGPQGGPDYEHATAPTFSSPPSL